MSLTDDFSDSTGPAGAQQSEHPRPSTETTDGGIKDVGTGEPRLMVVTVETCQGPRAYFD